MGGVGIGVAKGAHNANKEAFRLCLSVGLGSGSGSGLGLWLGLGLGRRRMRAFEGYYSGGWGQRWIRMQIDWRGWDWGCEGGVECHKHRSLGGWHLKTPTRMKGSVGVSIKWLVGCEHDRELG